MTDLELLAHRVQPEDRGADWLQGSNYYNVYRALGERFRPRIIGEIGVRFGYSLWCLASGAAAVKVYGWDNQSYVSGCLEIARRNLADFDPTLIMCDTQRITGLECDPLDLFHVDADHTEAGALHDLKLAAGVTRHEGVILVDDTSHCPPVNAAVERFCRICGATVEYLPTLRGMGVIRRVGIP